MDGIEFEARLNRGLPEKVAKLVQTVVCFNEESGFCCENEKKND